MNTANTLADAVEAIRSLTGSGRLDEAEARLAPLLLDDAAKTTAAVNAALGRLRHAQGRAGEALAAFQQALKRDASHVDGLNDFAALLMAAGRLPEAAALYQRLTRAHPQLRAGYLGLARVSEQQGRRQQAIETLSRGLANSDDPALALPLARLLRAQGDLKGAYDQLLQYADRLSSDTRSLDCLSELAWLMDRTEDALNWSTQSLLSKPSAAALTRRVDCLIRLGRLDDALEALAGFQPASPEEAAHKALQTAIARMYQGELDAAYEANEEALRLLPGLGQAWLNKVQLRPDAVTDADLAAMQSLVSATSVADPWCAVRAGFALAQAQASRADRGQEMAALSDANALAAKLSPFDADAAASRTRALIRQYQQLVSVEPVSSAGQDDLRPVFILGLPRSGTTLVERMIAAHSQIDAGGESRALTAALDGQSPAFFLDHAHPQRLAGFRERYCATVRAQGCSAARVTDKAINLYRHAGLLGAAFPGATFIVMRRHPLDVCLGGWRRLFQSQPHTFSVEGLAQSVADFGRFISFWRDDYGLPVHEIDFEWLVAEPEAAAKQIADWIDVPFESLMFEPHRKAGAVRTLSTVQVRQPITAENALRWTRYVDHVTVFSEALRRRGVPVEGQPE